VRQIWRNFKSMYHRNIRNFKYFIIVIELVELCCTSLADYFLLSELGELKRSFTPLFEVFDMNIITLQYLRR
jgi:hypothetical protein